VPACDIPCSAKTSAREISYVMSVQVYGCNHVDRPTGVTGPQIYVHRCHIVEHEDNDMMRPFTVIS
jgi:hypothetical protein